MLYTADRETGTFIDEITSIQEGLELIREYETADWQDGIHEDGYYTIVDENHCEIDF